MKENETIWTTQHKFVLFLRRQALWCQSSVRDGLLTRNDEFEKTTLFRSHAQFILKELPTLKNRCDNLSHFTGNTQLHKSHVHRSTERQKNFNQREAIGDFQTAQRQCISLFDEKCIFTLLENVLRTGHNTGLHLRSLPISSSKMITVLIVALGIWLLPFLHVTNRTTQLHQFCQPVPSSPKFTDWV